MTVENFIFTIATLALGGLVVARATVLPLQIAPPPAAAAIPAVQPSAPVVPIHAVRGGEREGGFFSSFDD